MLRMAKFLLHSSLPYLFMPLFFLKKKKLSKTNMLSFSLSTFITWEDHIFHTWRIKTRVLNGGMNKIVYLKFQHIDLSTLSLFPNSLFFWLFLSFSLSIPIFILLQFLLVSQSNTLTYTPPHNPSILFPLAFCLSLYPSFASFLLFPFLTLRLRYLSKALWIH